MALPTPTNFAAYAPDYQSYFNSGAQAVNNAVSTYNAAQTAEWQRQQRAIQLQEYQRKHALDALLAPYDAQAAQQRVEQGKVNLLQSKAEYANYLRDNPTGPISYLGSGMTPPINVQPMDAGGSTITPTATGYHPASSDSPEYKMEGGNLDAQGNKIVTLDAFRRGEAPYVTAAIDRSSPLFGQTIFSPSLGAPLKFSDTGGAFKGKGNSRVDIARDNAAGANSDENNGPITLSLGGTTPAMPTQLKANPVSITPPVSTFVPIGQTPPIAQAAFNTAQATAPISPLASAALRQKASQVPVQYGMGFIDPGTGLPTFGTGGQAASLGVKYGMVGKPLGNANQAKADLASVKDAGKMGYDGDLSLDATGQLSQSQRDDIEAFKKDALSHKGTAIPAKTRDAARQMGIPIEGKSFDEVTQALQDKQINEGLIPPELRVPAERLQSQIYQHPILKDYPKLREAKESFDAGYNNQDTGGFGDMALVEGMQRMLNPGMGVRAQTMTQMLKGAGLAQYLSPSFVAEHIAQGEKFSPEVRDRMKKLADDIFARANANANPALNGMKRQAKSYGIPNPDAFVDNVLTIAPVLDATGQPDNAPLPTVATANSQSNPANVNTQMEYDALPSGSFYTDSNGTLHRKK